MKQNLLFILIFTISAIVNAQNQARHIKFNYINKDSVSLTLNDEYYLIEDSCAQIIRYSHFNFEQHKFSGKFKDVSKADSNLIVSEGNYTADGLKEGVFISHYLNGDLQAKGNFKNNKYYGHWEMYYEDGKPELTFDVVDGNCQIINAWGADGKKSVDNGNGVYEAKLDGTYWKGKLVNGKPDGKWNFIRTDDASETSIALEHFKKGQFHDGSVGAYEYSDVSRIVLVDPSKLPFVTAERMFISPVPCNGVKRKHIVGAQYKDGLKFFTQYISDAVSSYLGGKNLSDWDTQLDIEGEVSELGEFINLKCQNSTAGDLSQGLVTRLKRLPPLNPATADGKPIKQKFVISFVITKGYYHFSYRFLPIKLDQ